MSVLCWILNLAVVRFAKRFLTTYLKSAKTENGFFSVRNNNQYFIATASILFDVFICSTIDFQCSNFHSAIFILQFCVLNLHWMKIPKFVNNHRRNCTKRSPNLKTRGEFVSNYAYRANVFNSSSFIFVKHKLW